MIAPVFFSLRPKQWFKNIIIFTALLFSEKGLLLEPDAWLHTIAGFFIFCGLSGCVYLLNDIVDIDKDSLHPEKCHRPIPSGELSITEAKSVLVILLIVSLGAAYTLSILFFSMSLAYFMLNIFYSFKLKDIVIIDIMSIALGFVLRAIAGVGALKNIDPEIYISHWLLLFTFMLAMFLGLTKRRQEIAIYEDKATSYRYILAHYSLNFIDQATSILAATTIITYSFYTVSPDTVAKFKTEALIYTVPSVIYGILRYFYLIHIKKMGENPSEIIATDRPLQVNVLIWLVIVICIIHHSRLGWFQ